MFKEKCQTLENYSIVCVSKCSNATIWGICVILIQSMGKSLPVSKPTDKIWLLWDQQRFFFLQSVGGKSKYASKIICLAFVVHINKNRVHVIVPDIIILNQPLNQFLPTISTLELKEVILPFSFFFLLFKHFVWTGFTRIGTGQLVFMISVSSAWWIVDWTIKKCTHPTFSNCNSIPMPWLQISEIRSNTGIKWISCVFDCEEATAMLHPC